MRKVNVCVLIVLVICTILSGCSGNSNPIQMSATPTTQEFSTSGDVSGYSADPSNVNKNTPSVDPVLLTDEDLENLRGMTVRILAVGRDYLSGEDCADSIKAIIAERNRVLEEKLGATIIVDTIPLESTSEELLKHLSSKDAAYDAVMLPSDYDLSVALNSEYKYPFRMIKDDFLSFETDLFTKTAYYEYDDDGSEVEKGVCYIASEIDPAYTEAIGVCYVNKELFGKYSSEIAALKSSGGFSTLSEIVNGGYWTEDFIADLCTLFNQKEENANVFVPCDEIMFGARQADLFFAGCGVKTTTQKGTKRVSMDDFYIMNNYKSTMAEKDNKDTYDLFFNLWASSGKTYSTRDDAYNKLKSGNVLLSFDALSAFTTYSLQNEVEILPLPMKDHAQFNGNAPSLGYCSVLLASEGYGQIAFVRQAQADDDQRSKLVAAVFSELAYLSRISLTPTVLEKASEEQFSVISLCKAGLFSDVTRTWTSEAGYNELFGMMAAMWSKAYSSRSIISNWVSVHNNSLNDFAKKTAEATL